MNCVSDFDSDLFLQSDYYAHDCGGGMSINLFCMASVTFFREYSLDSAQLTFLRFVASLDCVLVDLRIINRKAVSASRST